MGVAEGTQISATFVPFLQVVETVVIGKDSKESKSNKKSADPLSNGDSSKEEEVLDPLSLASMADPLSAVLSDTKQYMPSFGAPKSETEVSCLWRQNLCPRYRKSQEGEFPGNQSDLSPGKFSRCINNIYK